MYCPHCRRQLPEDDAFCPYDGSPLVRHPRTGEQPAAPGQGRAPSPSRSAPTVRLPDSGRHPAVSPRPTPAGAEARPPSREVPTLQLGGAVGSPSPVILGGAAARPVAAPPAAAPVAHYALAPGTAVGEYRVTGELGHGGMTVVYAGVHPVIGKQVAIKVLRATHSRDDDLLARFVQEAQAVNRVGSDRIVDVFGFGHLPDGRAYLIMDRVEGQPLEGLVESGGPLATTQAYSIFLDVAAALSAAHSVGIVHRDVKPSNVMVQLDTYGHFRAKVLDFGVAKLLRSTLREEGGVQTAHGMMIGTPTYMSPEQVLGREVDPRSDVYCFGMTLFYALTRAIPFEVTHHMDVTLCHLHTPPKPPSALREGLSPDWDRLVLDCLQKDPAARPQTMEEVRNRIARLGADAARGGTGYLTIPSWADPEAVLAALKLRADAPAAPAPAPSRWPIFLAVGLGAAAAAGLLVYLLVK